MKMKTLHIQSFVVFVCVLFHAKPVTGFASVWRLPAATAHKIWKAHENDHGANEHETTPNGGPISGTKYNLGIGKNQPVGNATIVVSRSSTEDDMTANGGATKRRKLVATDKQSETLRRALWDESHFSSDNDVDTYAAAANWGPGMPVVMYPDIDLSIPETVYSQDGSVDLVWDLLRYEAYQESLREPLLVSFMHSTILNHASLESSLAFLLANRLQSPAMMISTQLQSLILEALHQSPDFRRALRADIMAVRDRDPACNALPDVFLYFKGFHALESHRVAHYLWHTGRQVLASYLQSQVSQVFQIDIHPNATLGSGIMLDHGTGIVIGETARVGHNCSILHHVTLGGSGKKGVVRHPQVGDGVLLGAGATVLNAVKIGDGSQVGAGTLVISDLPAHCVAVGGTYSREKRKLDCPLNSRQFLTLDSMFILNRLPVPARVIGNFIDETEQPSIEMNQVPDQQEMRLRPDFFGSDGI